MTAPDQNPPCRALLSLRWTVSTTPPPAPGRIMSVPQQAFRQYDIRGIVGDELTPQLAHEVGRALATIIQRQLTRPARIAVGRDNRPSGDLLASAMRDGIAAAGATAVDVGMLPTPGLYFAAWQLESDGGVQVTGSHNPPEFNGFKMITSDGAVYGEQIQEIKRMIDGGSADSGVGQLEIESHVLRDYAEAIVERNGPLQRHVRVVVDCGNGVASLIAEHVLTRLGADVVPLFCESDGTFPNHHPDPTVMENLVDLQETVRRSRAEIGIAFDGDGDRIGAVDETGRVVFGDHLLILLGRDLASRSGPGHSVIFDVKCSNVLHDELKKVGLEPVIWKTGHSLIKAKMKELNAPLAGEMSGHMFFGGDYLGFDDALFAAARLLDFMAKQDGPLSALTSDIPETFATPELRVDCPDEQKFSIVERAAEHFSAMYEVLTLDGARVNFAEGWGLIRASNTEPVIVMRFEASTQEQMQRYRDEVEGWLRRQGVVV